AGLGDGRRCGSSRHRIPTHAARYGRAGHERCCRDVPKVRLLRNCALSGKSHNRRNVHGTRTVDDEHQHTMSSCGEFVTFSFFSQRVMLKTSSLRAGKIALDQTSHKLWASKAPRIWRGTI